MSEDATWENMLAAKAAKYKDRVVFSWLEQGSVKARISYADLLQQSDIVAARLQKQFRPSQRIALVFRPGLDFIEAFFACTRAGLIPVPLSPSLGRHQFASIVPILINCRATAVLGHEMLWNRHRTHAESVDQTQAIIWLNWSSIKAEARELNAERHPRSQGGIAFLQYTSGSSGNPKGVIVGHTNILHNLQQIIKKCDSTRPRVMLSWLPHFHDMGLIGGILHAVYSGSELLLMAPTDFIRRPALWLEMIHSHRVAFSIGPESALDLVQRRIDNEHLKALDLSCLECMLCGSEPIRRSVLNGFIRTLQPAGLRQDVIVNGYGLAEATLMSTASRYINNSATKHGSHEDKAALASSGCSIDEQLIRIISPTTMVQLPQGNEGLIMIKGPSVSRGYWSTLEADSCCFNQTLINEQGQKEEGYLNTGDLGIIVDGQLTVTGRIKDLIVVSGRNIHPCDVEMVVRSLSPRYATSRCICFGVLKEERSEQLVILIESQTKRLDPEDAKLLSFVAQQISGAFGAQTAAVLLMEPNTLPITTSGKVRRQEAKQRYCNSLFNPLACWPQDLPEDSNVNVVLSILKRELASLIGRDPLLVEASQNLDDFALSSLQLAELKIALDQELQTDLPISPFLAGLTLRKLAKRISELVAALDNAQQDTILNDSAALHNLMLAGLPDHLRALQQQHGDWLSLRWGRQVIHLLNDPTEVQNLMQRPTSEFIRGKVFEGIRMVTDDSNLFTTEGPAWRRERQRAQPLLTRQAVETMAGDFAAISRRCLTQHHTSAGSSALDLTELCRDITLQITLHKLFGPISGVMAQRLTAALSAETDWRLPLHYLAQAELREAAAAKTVGASNASIDGLLPELDALVYGAIDANSDKHAAPTCLLASYMNDPEVLAMDSGERRRYLRSVMLSLVLAGLDSTGSGLFFCLDLLGRHAESQRHVRDEVHTAFGDGAISPTDLPRQLPYTLAVVQEALRLYPPVWFLGREAVTTTMVMGQSVAAGEIVLTSPYVIHRHPDHWSEPDQFRPERFLKQAAAGSCSHLFMPFGVGGRTCVGRWLALYEMTLAVAALVQQHQLVSDGEEHPELSSYFTLRTLKPINLSIKPIQ